MLRSDPAITGKKQLDLGRYLPVSDPKNPPHFLVFCDVNKDKIDAYRGVPIRSAEGLDYVKKALALDPNDPAGNLDFYFRYLENPDKEIALRRLPGVRAGQRPADRPGLGQAVGREAARLDQRPADAAGTGQPVRLPAGRLRRRRGRRLPGGPAQRRRRTDGQRLDGYLGGYIHLRPRDGWEKALAVLRDGRKPLPMRLAVVRTVRMYHGWRPKESRDHVLKCLEAMIAQGELADIAIEDLRRWKMWDRTPDILALYGKKGFDAPIMERAIVRYALSCGDEAAKKFVGRRGRRSSRTW